MGHKEVAREMSTQVKTDQAGEHIVARELAAKGYRTNVDTRGPGSTDIEARRSTDNLLVQVKTAVAPNAPAGLSSDEERNIKSRAAREGYQAWEAKLQVDSALNMVGAIAWRQLS
jgi:hypothetical protein